MSDDSIAYSNDRELFQYLEVDLRRGLAYCWDVILRITSTEIPLTFFSGHDRACQVEIGNEDEYQNRNEIHVTPLKSSQATQWSPTLGTRRIVLLYWTLEKMIYVGIGPGVPLD